MKEGWIHNEYYVLFEPNEIDSITEAYGISKIFPDFKLFGIKQWDNFIISKEIGKYFAVPFVPLDPKYLIEIEWKLNEEEIEDDNEIKGKIKWHIKPIVFSGDPLSKDNIIWITMEEHQKLVNWWNNKYKQISETNK